MKYKITPESNKDLFDKITALFKRGEECNKAANDWIINHFGEFKPYAIPYSSMFGGILAVRLDKKPDGWRVEGKDWQNLFAPKANNKKVLAELKQLPMVKSDELKELLSYKNYSGPSSNRFGFTMNSRPGVIVEDEYILLDASNQWKPIAGVVEILESEYNMLSGEISATQ